MLEWGDALRTWNLFDLPIAWADTLEVAGEAETVTAISVTDHRIDYLDYEGPVSGDRGFVQQCDTGTYQLLDQSAAQLEVLLNGQHLHGKVRLEVSSANANAPWLLTIER